MTKIVSALLHFKHNLIKAFTGLGRKMILYIYACVCPGLCEGNIHIHTNIYFKSDFHYAQTFTFLIALHGVFLYKLQFSSSYGVYFLEVFIC